MIVLSHLTHLETRVLEQSLITKFSPEFNITNVYFSYNFWDPSTLYKSYNSKNLNATFVEVWLENPKEILMTFFSQLKAAEGLGVSSNLITRYLNKPFSFKSNLLELNVFVRTSEGIMNNSSIIHPKAKQYPLIKYDLNSLEEEYIYALNLDKSKIEYKYKTTKSVIKHLYPFKFKNNLGDIQGRYVSIYYNQEKLIKTELGNFYFVCNPNTLTKLKSKGLSKMLWIINLKTGLALKFDTMVKASKYLNIKYIDSISNHLDKFTIYKNNYQFVSDTKFKNLFIDVTGTEYQCDLNKLPLKKLNTPLPLTLPSI